MKADMYLGENNCAVNGMDLISAGTCFEARIDRKEGAPGLRAQAAAA